MINLRADGRLGATQLRNVYGDRFGGGPTTSQLGAAAGAGLASNVPSPQAAVVFDRHTAIAAFFLSTPAGVAILVGLALIVMSLRD